MKLLIKQGIDCGQSAHIPDAQGRPLCKGKLRLANWVIANQQSTLDIVCHSCLRVQAKHEKNSMHIECISASVAELVQGILLHHGVRSSRQGPLTSSGPTITIMPIGAIDSEKESALRQDIQCIAGTTLLG